MGKILLCGIIQKIAFIIEPGAMARAVPAFFVRIPFQLATQMRALHRHDENLPVFVFIYARFLPSYSTIPPCPGERASSSARGGLKKVRDNPAVACAVSSISILADAEGLNRCGEKTSASGWFRPMIWLVKICAATMEEVIPHFWNPVATYQWGVEEENGPM